jgi:hypothetical protein
LVPYAGRDVTVRELSELTGVRYEILRDRIKRGLTPDDAVAKPIFGQGKYPR